MKKIIYRITINKWEQYNPKSKPGHRCIMLSKRFLDDAKIQTLPLGGKVLFLGLLLRRGEVNTTFFEATHKDLVTLSGGSGQVVSRLMSLLKENQLLSYEVLNELNLKEVKRKEKKRKELPLKGGGVSEKQEPAETPELIPSDQRSGPPYKKLLELWNMNSGSLPKAKTSNKNRDKKMKSLWPLLDELQWVEVIKKLAQSDFCNGKNDRGWKADFDFFLKPETATRALEGRYDNRVGIKNGMTEDGRYLTNAVKRSHNNKIMIEKYLKPEKKEEENAEQIRDVGSDSLNR